MCFLFKIDFYPKKIIYSMFSRFYFYDHIYVYPSIENIWENIPSLKLTNLAPGDSVDGWLRNPVGEHTSWY